RYSTKRDWSIPHYEKMLSDQAKLIRAYAHLLKITNDDKVKIAVDGSVSFVTSKFLDNHGGFYSSQDAYLEDEYFALPEKEREKIESPYIDKTRNIDSNSMMIGTFFYLYNLYGDEEYKEIAKESLNFLQNNLVGEEGAYYYFDYEKEKPFLTGQAISNSWAILAFLDGYDSLKEQSYLKSAKELADYSLDNLYDWNAGGFFERNSKDTEFYAPNERIDLSKPYEENAVFSYGMLRLYLLTGNLEYLESGLKTLGYLLSKGSGLDETYHTIKSFQLVKKNNLLEIYAKNKNEIDDIAEKRQTDFFLNGLLGEVQNNISLNNAPTLKDEFSNVGFLILSLLAFSAGMLSFLSPCCLPVLSAYFAHNVNSNRGEVLKNTIFFFLGLATVFSIFGMGATLIGSIFRENRLIFTQVAGAIIVIFGVLEILGKGFSGLHIRLRKNNKTPVSSYLFGTVFAIGWSACIGPILASLLLLSATTGTVLKGSALLFIYTLGLGIPLIIISFYFDRIKNKRFWRILHGRMISFKIFGKEINVHSTYLISGIILIIIGILIFNDYLYRLNQLALRSTYVQEIIISGEQFLKNLFVR
ncbi:sulfite exporter TauE/SafE family protein, partial [Candidatus Woesearchaeota archaeon]|nr:sulfite exporter TauE/SafE family protein [Candidatus Woesearchaeota archaeon]